ncbi:hypothetical protein Tco_0449929 [Tanacetum coccineum]
MNEKGSIYRFLPVFILKMLGILLEISDLRWFLFVPQGELFGLILVSDKSVPSRSHFFEPDVTRVPLFNHDWRNPINIRDSALVYLGNPGSGQPCNHKKEIDLSSFWDRKSDGECGELFVVSEHGIVEMNYILLKDAIDTSFRVKFETKPDTRLVRGYAQAYYGDEFLYKCQSGSICK